MNELETRGFSYVKPLAKKSEQLSMSIVCYTVCCADIFFSFFISVLFIIYRFYFVIFDTIEAWAIIWVLLTFVRIRIIMKLSIYTFVLKSLEVLLIILLSKSFNASNFCVTVFPLTLSLSKLNHGSILMKHSLVT